MKTYFFQIIKIMWSRVPLGDFQNSQSAEISADFWKTSGRTFVTVLGDVAHQKTRLPDYFQRNFCHNVTNRQIRLMK